jgi:hypothetical protein
MEFFESLYKGFEAEHYVVGKMKNKLGQGLFF